MQNFADVKKKNHKHRWKYDKLGKIDVPYYPQACLKL